MAPLIRLLLNAHTAFLPPVPPQSQPPLSTLAWSALPAPAHALSLLSAPERTKVLRYIRPSDAALSLGSCLLKRLAVVRGLGVGWEEAGRGLGVEEGGGKPMWERPRGGGGEEQGQQGRVGREVEFNVSHHGEVVVLVASVAEGTPEAGTWKAARKVGVDVVRVDLARDTAAVQRAGAWSSWVRIYADVFPDDEVAEIIRYYPLVEDVMEVRLRKFYAHWGLREAYVKMTGEALLATWLKELRFREVVVPVGGEGWGQGEWSVECWLRGKREGCGVEVRSWGPEYLVVTVVEEGFDEGEWGNWGEVKVDKDLVPLARR